MKHNFFCFDHPNGSAANFVIVVTTSGGVTISVQRDGVSHVVLRVLVLVLVHSRQRVERNEKDRYLQEHVMWSMVTVVVFVGLLGGVCGYGCDE